MKWNTIGLFVYIKMIFSETCILLCFFLYWTHSSAEIIMGHRRQVLSTKAQVNVITAEDPIHQASSLRMTHTQNTWVTTVEARSCMNETWKILRWNWFHSCPYTCPSSLCAKLIQFVYLSWWFTFLNCIHFPNYASETNTV